MDIAQPITLPAYVVGLYTGLVFSWMLYLAWQEKNNTRDIALLKQSFLDIDEDLKGLRDNFNDRMDRQDHRMGKIEDKIDKIYDFLHDRRN